MHVFRLAIVVAAAFSLSGCLMVEVFQYHIIMLPDGRTARAESTYRNVMASEAGDQAEIDFNELVASWKGPEYVAQRAKVGVRVIDRQLSIDQGQLIGRQTAEFSDTSAGFEDFFTRDTVRLAFMKKDIDTITSTNGAVYPSHDSVVIAWPRAMRDFSVSIRFKLPGPGFSLVPRFEQYLRNQQGK